jgi:8-oxo-dGTP pyrophosphatase MutT (NUDIX family)
MVTRERSAGVILFHLSRTKHVRTYLILYYGKHWDYPKGHVEAGESALEAAMRELAEETGITKVVLIPGFAREISYFFRHPRRGLIRKEVIFFLAEVKSKKATLSHEHVGFEFLPFDQAIRRVTYPTARQMLREAEDHLNHRSLN